MAVVVDGIAADISKTDAIAAERLPHGADIFVNSLVDDVSENKMVRIGEREVHRHTATVATPPSNDAQPPNPYLQASISLNTL